MKSNTVNFSLLSYFSLGVIEAGIDEAGRGCLAGDVFAAAVILPQDFNAQYLNDSKQVSEKHRNELRKIIEAESIAFSVQRGSIEEIETINILQANYNAMHRCIDDLDIKPELLLIDGNRFRPYFGIPHQCIVKGDSKYLSIAAASILAKTYRDEYMLKLHEEYPQYRWNENKGYATVAHRKALIELGPTPYHRKTFICKNLDLIQDNKNI